MNKATYIIIYIICSLLIVAAFCLIGFCISNFTVGNISVDDFAGSLIATTFFIINGCCGVYILECIRRKENQQPISEYSWVMRKSFLIPYFISITLAIIAIIVVSFIFSKVYLLFLLIHLPVAGFVLGYYFVFKDSQGFKNKTTKRFVRIVSTNEFYMNGVNVFDDSTRVKLEGKTIKLIYRNTHINEFLENDEDEKADNLNNDFINIKREFICNDIYEVQGKKYKFLVAIYHHSKNFYLIYDIRFKDQYRRFAFDFNENAIADADKNYSILTQFSAEFIQNRKFKNDGNYEYIGTNKFSTDFFVNFSDNFYHIVYKENIYADYCSDYIAEIYIDNDNEVKVSLVVESGSYEIFNNENYKTKEEAIVVINEYFESLKK